MSHGVSLACISIFFFDTPMCTWLCVRGDEPSFCFRITGWCSLILKRRLSLCQTESILLPVLKNIWSLTVSEKNNINLISSLMTRPIVQSDPIVVILNVLQHNTFCRPLIFPYGCVIIWIYSTYPSDQKTIVNIWMGRRGRGLGWTVCDELCMQIQEEQSDLTERNRLRVSAEFCVGSGSVTDCGPLTKHIVTKFWQQKS